jgi:hypothetical protein
MAETFEDGGIRFRYPENWDLERVDDENGWTVTLQSPGTAFAMFNFRDDLPTPEDMADTALAAMREEYPELEADERVETVAGQMAFGHDIRFFSLDLTNTCWTRCFFTPAGTVLLLCQTSDLDEDVSVPVLQAICASLEIEAD